MNYRKLTGWIGTDGLYHVRREYGCPHMVGVGKSAREAITDLLRIEKRSTDGE
jgi:hypothetical protein